MLEHVEGVDVVDALVTDVGKGSMNRQSVGCQRAALRIVEFDALHRVAIASHR